MGHTCSTCYTTGESDSCKMPRYTWYSNSPSESAFYLPGNDSLHWIPHYAAKMIRYLENELDETAGNFQEKIEEIKALEVEIETSNQGIESLQEDLIKSNNYAHNLENTQDELVKRSFEMLQRMAKEKDDLLKQKLKEKNGIIARFKKQKNQITQVFSGTMSTLQTKIDRETEELRRLKL